jgi:hypothetical protein
MSRSTEPRRHHRSRLDRTNFRRSAVRAVLQMSVRCFTEGRNVDVDRIIDLDALVQRLESTAEVWLRSAPAQPFTWARC